MKRYPQELVSALHLSDVHKTVYGTDVRIKPVPDDPRAGVLDPRELLFAKESAKRRSEIKEPQTLEEMRADMGFAGLAIHETAVWTDCIYLQNGDNTVRIWKYFPRLPEGKKDRPALIYVHGGGWIGGSPMDYEGACKYIAQIADCVVFNVEYSLAPEKQYPNGLDDTWCAVSYICDNAASLGVDAGRIGIAGDSAGGNLAAACCLKDRDLKTGYLNYAVLLYPALKLTAAGPEGYVWSIDDYCINPEQFEYIDPSISIDRPTENDDNPQESIRSLYIPKDQDPSDPYISPMLAGSLKGLCRTMIVDAEFDGLRIENEYYGKMLRDAGNDVCILRYNGMRHGFIEKTGYLPQAEDLCMEIAAYITGA